MSWRALLKKGSSMLQEAAATAVEHAHQAAAQAAEVVAPRQQKSPLENVQAAWRQVTVVLEDIARQERSGQDGAMLLARSRVRECLRAVVAELRAEDGRGDSATGPCLEFVLHEDVLLHLCHEGCNDRPSGMLELALQTLAELLAAVRHPLLPARRVHQALRRLLLAAIQVDRGGGRIEASGADPRGFRAAYRGRVQKQLVSLVSVLWAKVASEPVYIDLFLVDRGGLLLYSALEQHLFEGGELGESARGALLQAVGLRIPRLHAFVAGDTHLLAELAEGLGQAFLALPPELSARDDDDECSGGSAREATARHLEFMLGRLRFCAALSMAGAAVDGELPEGARTVCDELVAQVRAAFFERVVGAALQETSEARACAATVYVQRMVEALGASAPDAPLLAALVHFLLAPEGPMRAVLLHRISSLAEAVSVSTLDLVCALVDHGGAPALRLLVLDNLEPCAHLDWARFPAPPTSDLEALVAFVQAFPGAPLPSADGPTHDEGFQAYLADAERVATVAVAAEAVLPAGPCGSDSEDEDDDVAAPPDELLAGVPSLDAVLAAASPPPPSVSEEEEEEPPVSPLLRSVPSTDEERRDAGAVAFAEGLFLEQLFARCEDLLDHSLESNLALTGAVIKLAQTMHPLVHQLLFEVTPAGVAPLRADVRSLLAVLRGVWAEAQQRVARIADHEARMAAMRQRMGVSLLPSDGGRGRLDSGDYDSLSDKKLLEAAVLLEEFLKELASTLQARFFLLAVAPRLAPAH